ncbi:hypothetical protein K461DRAFT_229816 [Myriangium duriaei CBS 260.36]|uniref:Protein YAE1 n=1 Tax=Myriangium duriaei CBS 260.36 TaxID=1168546 RepID=A0A9P4IYU6_9PEZI|nr:hypothetical protein K461DRAFT_229816 [Myriangium duriaei CBS 260.36]
MDTPESPVYEDVLDDVFGSSASGPEGIDREINGELSENARLRSIHVTNGYRDGIAESKSRFVQAGFDEGYPLGAVLGYKAAWFIKVLDLFCSGLRTASSTPDTISRMESALSEARQDLSMDRIFSSEYFDEDGVWKFTVTGDGDGDSECDFDQVAQHHPIMIKWTTLISDTAALLGLNMASPGQRHQERT